MATKQDSVIGTECFELERVLFHCHRFLCDLIGWIEIIDPLGICDDWRSAMWDWSNEVFLPAAAAVDRYPHNPILTSDDLRALHLGSKQLINFVWSNPSLSLDQWGPHCPIAILGQLRHGILRLQEVSHQLQNKPGEGNVIAADELAAVHDAFNPEISWSAIEKRHHISRSTVMRRASALGLRLPPRKVGRRKQKGEND